MSGSLFDDPTVTRPPSDGPLADRMRPRHFDELVGQEPLLGPDRPLRQAIERDTLQSIILWGPPGSGKTTLARLIAATTASKFVAFSAVLSGIKEIRAVMAEAEQARHLGSRRTILFVDEIHRFNKAQQDAFLPHVESGLITLIGATTELAESDQRIFQLAVVKIKKYLVNLSNRHFLLEPLATVQAVVLS